MKVATALMQIFFSLFLAITYKLCEPELCSYSALVVKKKEINK